MFENACRGGRANQPDRQPGSEHDRSLLQEEPDDPSARGTERHSDRDLALPLLNGACRHAINPEHGEESGNRGKSVSNVVRKVVPASWRFSPTTVRGRSTTA